MKHNINEDYEFMDPWTQEKEIFEADLRIYEPSITINTIRHILTSLYA